jgi:hypothetical protein
MVLALLIPLLLAACGSEAMVRDAYTASGDGSRPDELAKTDVFRSDDDLNVVVTLNAHNRELPVYAIFVAPTGDNYATDDLAADSTVGQVLLGLDWEAQGSVLWPEGEWTVDVYVDADKENSQAKPTRTLKFTVEPIAEASG